MVKFVYKNGPRVTVNPDLTVSQAIEQVVAGHPDLGQCCVIFNNQRLDNSMVIREIPGIEEHQTLRVVHTMSQDPSSNSNTPTMDQLVSCFDRLADNEIQRIASFVQSPNFKQELLNKYPALFSDTELLSILSDLTIIRGMIEHNNADFLSKHPMFVPAVYAIFERVFSPDAIKRLFGSGRHVGGNMSLQDNFHQLLGGFLPAGAATSSTQGAPRANHNAVITSEMFDNALQAISGGGAEAQAPVANNALERYADQLTQLHEFGFMDDNENVLALDAAGGNVELALDIIIRSRED